MSRPKVVLVAAESDRTKRNLLLKRQSCVEHTQIYDCVSALGVVNDTEAPFEYRSATHTLSLDTDVWILGFPCKDLSVLNPRPVAFDHSSCGTSSQVFFKSMSALKMRKPKLVVIENVLGMLRRRQGQPASAWTIVPSDGNISTFFAKAYRCFSLER